MSKVDSFYLNWKPIDLNISRQVNQKIEVCEYFHSVNLQQHEGFRYKIINGDFVMARFVCRGTYSAIKYCNTNTSEKTNRLLTEKGFTLRGSDVLVGEKNILGDEFVYNSDEFLKMEGSRFDRVRNTIRNMKEITFLDKYHKDIDFVVRAWSKNNNSTHQIKLINFLKTNQDLKFTRAYYKDKIIGFSIVEKINEKNSVIIQMLLNPEIIPLLKEPNIIVHYGTCQANPHMLLNIGCARTRGIKIAKTKLVPYTMLDIKRNISNRKLTKKEWEALRGKETLTLTTLTKYDIIKP